MPRYRRQTAPGSVQHVISRFVNRERRFDHPGARAEYLRRVPKALARSDWKVIAFALMSTHVHWTLLAGRKPSASFIKPLHSGFAGWLNRAQGRVGPVFADRHRTITCEGATAAALIAYIHNNPVRGRCVSDPARSSWTSHRAYLGLAPAPSWLEVERGLELCGFAPTAAGRRQFRDFVRARAGEPRSIELSGGDLKARRRSARAQLSSPIEIAAPTAVTAHNVLTLHAPVDVPNGCLVRTPWQGAVEEVLLAVSRSRGMSIDDVRSRSKSRGAVAARRLALLTWSAHLQRPIVEMARALGIAGSTASELIASASPVLETQAIGLACAIREDGAVLSLALRVQRR